MDAIERAGALFEQGYNCSQAVLAALAPDLGLDEATALRLAAGFGGGMGRMGEVCGAVTGAIMVLGCRHGSLDAGDSAAKSKVYRLVQEHASGFCARHGTLLCRELLGCNIGEEAGMALARQQNLFRTRCPRYVRDSAELAQALLDQP